MTTFSSFLVLCLLVGSTQGASLRQLVGDCAELCPVEGCPVGTGCQSNGCGHECFSLTSTPQPTGCRQGRMCALVCENGFAVGSDGCPRCACRPDD